MADDAERGGAERGGAERGGAERGGADAVDVAVVGAGIVGLATAYRLLQRRPDLRVAVLDKEPAVAAHQSSHNSGVLHSGVYYAPGSLKADLCRRGKRAVEGFAERHGIPVERCGKVIVAVRPDELGRLRGLHERAAANGLAGLRMLGPEELREREPHAAGLRALLVPETAVVDFAEVARALAAEVVAAGGRLVLGTAVQATEPHRTGAVLRTDAGALHARAAIACAGLHSDRFVDPPHDAEERILPFRGDYYTLVPEARSLCRGLIYPVPDPALPFLGVHFTRRVDGSVWAGPNAVLALAREGYGRTTFRWRDVREMAAFPGLWRLGRRWWRTGAAEVWRDASRSAFLRSLRRYVPEVERRHLSFGPSGVRAQAVRADGSMVDDFSIVSRGRRVVVRNAPSPAATASLAIGDRLAVMMEAVLGGTGAGGGADGR